MNQNTGNKRRERKREQERERREGKERMPLSKAGGGLPRLSEGCGGRRPPHPLLWSLIKRDRERVKDGTGG